MSHRLMGAPSWRSRLFSFVLKRKFKPMMSADKLDLPRLRQQLEQQAKNQKIDPEVLIEAVAEEKVKGEWQIPEAADEQSCILYCHGGGYSFCSPTTHRPMTAALAKQSGIRVFSLDYRLSPEHPFPAPIEDAVNCYQWLRDQGIQPANIVLAGDSAGGGLCMALLLKLKRMGEALPSGALLLSPWTDLAATGASVMQNESSCAMFYAESIAAGGAIYLAGESTTHPLASPLYGDLSDLPPLWITVSDNEVLRDDSIRLAERVEQQGGEVELSVWKKQPHVWPTFYPFLPEAKVCVRQMADFVTRRLA
ncbi:MAG: alpha/beta hydrolase [Cellvibrionaceae bacterium]|nr:alpha/beta hydrolase [Cellvibrionaceae bacterium]